MPPFQQGRRPIMPIDDAASRKPSPAPVGVPRRFAVGTLMVIVTMYSVLFAFLTSLGANPVVFGVVAGFFTGVGVGQVVLFRGNRPRDASFVGGALLCPAILLVGLFADILFGPSALSREDVDIRMIAQLLSIMAYSAILGAPLGYLAGCATASVFFVMDRIKKAREDSAEETDRLRRSAADDVTRDERPPLSERLWLPVRSAIIGLSPRQKGRPVREAVNVFIIVGTVVGLAAPFQEWGWWIYLLGTAAAALVLAFLRGLFLCRWWAVLVLLVLGTMGAIGPGVILRSIYVYSGVSYINGYVSYSGVQIGDSVPLALIVVAGGLIGAMAAATLGWARWWLQRGNSTSRRGRATMRLGLVTAICVMLLYGAVWFWLYRVSKQPEQTILALVDKAGGRVMNISGDLDKRAPLSVWLDPNVEDDDLRSLSDCTILYRLGLWDARISDAGVAHLKTTRSLVELNLSGTGITDAGLEHLKGLNNLSSLSLDRTQVAGPGLQHLENLTSLHTLSLNETQVTDAGLVHLKSLTGLRFLSLNSTKISDAGLAHLKGLKNLTDVSFWNTQVTDAGLVHLKGLKNLEYINLSETRVTAAGVKKFGEALPDCRVRR